MVTDGSSLSIDWAQRGWRNASRRLSSVLAGRLLLLLACCFLAWCGFVLFASTSASAAEVNGDTGHESSSGLLGTDLLSQATGTVATLTDSVASGEVGQPARATSTADGTTHADGRSATDADEDAELLGSLTSSAVRSTHGSLTPVRAVVDPAGALVGTSLEQRSAAVAPVLLTAHQAGQAVLGRVAADLGPLTRSVPLSASVPVTLGAVSSNLGMASVTGQPLGSTGEYQPGPGAAAAHSVGDAAQAAAQAAGEASQERGAGGLPVQQDDRDGKPAGGLPAPASSTTSSTTNLGNGSGSAGSYAFAELVRMLAASRPSAAVPTTDADISSGDDERPSVSPD